MSDNMDEPFPDHPNGYCEGAGICKYCGRTLYNEYFKSIDRKKVAKKVNIIGVEELDAFDNNTLQQQGRNVHGALYKRINTLQRDLNILRESYKKQRFYIKELETINRDLSKSSCPNPDNLIPPPIMHALRMGGMPERFNTLESITEWIKLIVHTYWTLKEE